MGNVDGLNSGQRQTRCVVSLRELTRSFRRPPFYPAFPNKSCLAMSLNSKISRTANAPTTAPDETETAVAQALIDLENNVPDLKTELRVLQVSSLLVKLGYSITIRSA